MLARRRLTFLFMAAVAVPALGLALAAFRGLGQERVRMEQEFRARQYADAAEAAVQLEDWMLGLARRSEPPSDGVAVELRDGALHWQPAGALAYDPGPEPVPSGPPGSLVEAQRLELRNAKFVEALAAYRAARGTWPQWSLFLEARLLEKLGTGSEAQSAWIALAALPNVRLGSLPSSFLAQWKSGRRANLLDALEAGRWRLSRTQFYYYRESLGGNSRVPGPKQRLADAVAAFAQEPARRPVDGILAYWTTAPGGTRAVLLPASVLRETIWPKVRRDHLGISDDGRVLPLPAPPTALAVFDRQQRWLQSLLFLLVAVGGLGGYFLFRLLRREMEIAAMQADFVAAVSHEFRTPLAGISQLVHLLERDRVPDEQRRREYYVMMRRECARLTRLIENVLDFSRLDTGRQQYRRESVNTAELLRDVARDFQVESVIAPDLPFLQADREALATAVRNLLDNAVKYAGGARLEAACDGGRIEIRVSDNGPGIAPEETRRIFEKFYRAPGANARHVKGVGLGLALVKGIVEAHGGAVRVESRLGQGSVFTIELEGIP